MDINADQEPPVEPLQVSEEGFEAAYLAMRVLNLIAVPAVMFLLLLYQYLNVVLQRILKRLLVSRSLQFLITLLKMSTMNLCVSRTSL